MENTTLLKREYVYLQQPYEYEIAGCDCGNNNTQWSECQKHLWCAKCEKDFIPKHNGVFDGPIGLNISRMLGLYFHRLNLKTNQVEAHTSKGYYVKAISFLNDIDFEKSVEITIKELINEKENSYDVYLSLKDFSLNNKHKIDDNNLSTIIYTISVDMKITELELQINNNHNNLNFVKNENFDFFNKFILTQKLELKLKELSPGKISKI